MATPIFTISSNGNYLRKWEMVKFSSDGELVVIIGVRMKNGSIDIRMYPYEDVECEKFGRFIWWQLLKLLVFIRLI